MFISKNRPKNIFGKPARMRQLGKPARLDKVQLREMGKPAKRFPISDVGEFDREKARDLGNRLLQNAGESRFPRQENGSQKFTGHDHLVMHS
jgi:hypothetical protein